MMSCLDWLAEHGCNNRLWTVDKEDYSVEEEIFEIHAGGTLDSVTPRC